MRHGEGELAVRPFVRLEHTPGFSPPDALLGQEADAVEEEKGKDQGDMRADHEGQRGIEAEAEHQGEGGERDKTRVPQRQ